MASSYLDRTLGTPTNQYKYTISAWVKRCSLGSDQTIFGVGDDGQNNAMLKFTSDDQIQIYDHISNTDKMNIKTNRKFRDTNAWYHVFVSSDRSIGSPSTQIWVNGVQETSFASNNEYSQNDPGKFNTAVPHYVGAYTVGSQIYDGFISHFVFVDGSALAPTSFGQTDSTSGIWKFKSPSGVTFGNNGIHLKFENSGNLGLDSSGNSNNMNSNGSLRQAIDTPSNIYCTINRLHAPSASQSATLTFGNTKVAGNWNHWQRVYGSLGAKQGKWYYEFKNLNDNGSGNHCRVGWDSVDFINMGTDSYYSGLTLDRAGALRGGESGHNAYDPNSVQMTAAYSGGNFSYTANDILGMAIDIDNNTFSVYKNGNLEINAYSYASNSNCSILKSKGHFIAPSWNWYSASGNANRSCFNFGNGYFETTAITSAGSNGNGSLFEYDVRSGYYAWNTKNINTYG